MTKDKDDRDLDGLRGAALALTGVAAHLVASATGSQAADRLAQRIDKEFGIEDES